MIWIKRIIASIVFLLIFTVILAEASNVLMHKQIEGRWNMTAKVAGFYNEEPNSFDVLFFGSSHMYCSVDPTVFYEETGLSSYVFATQQQPLWVTYHYMVEALRTQNPELCVVEIHMAIQEEDYMDEGTNHSAIDPIPFSVNKLHMIRSAVPEGEKRYYIFNIMKYHERWEELEETDYRRTYEWETDPDKGHVRLTTAAIDVAWEDVSNIEDVIIGTDKNILYLNKIIDLAEQKGIRLVLLKAPSNATPEEKMLYNGVKQLAFERGVEYIDYNDKDLYKQVGLDIKEDFYDQHHLNETGMKKFVAHFSSYLFR